jgi:predicted RNA binding protein YcfA (HicA-like mRNA interferase family)
MPKISPLPGRKLGKVLELAGFSLVRTEGDHLVYTKAGSSRPCVIPDWPELPVFIVKNNLRTAGITREQYFELLKKV